MASAPNTSGMGFEVFLSFRGSDTRNNFTSCLYHNMIEKGIRVFKDDKELQVGEKIDELFKALDDSQIYIPIFSEDFASSAWCLREVAHMVDRTSEPNGKKEILPLFFDVTPEDVKSSTGLYSNALSKLEKEKVKYDPDEVKRWRDALREVATRVGWKREGKEYGELIGSIVREVQLKLKVKNRDLPDHLVKMDDEEVIEELLDVDSDGVRFVIIHGIGGIGKSTLAKVIFNKFLSKFSYSSFLEDVQSHRLLDMQKKLLFDTLGATSTDGIHDTNDGINRIRKGLSEKKVMVVVDNVNNKEQLKNLAGSYKWFGSGSRIIITVRDKRTIPYRTMLEEENQTRPSYYMDYQVKVMPPDRAIQLFSKHAFRSDTPPKDWHNFSEVVVSSIGRLPLTLEVVGSLFANTDISKWHETLKDLKQVPLKEVRDTLMISFNKLDLRKKNIFLDIACFCIGEDKMHAYYMWDDCGYSPQSAIDDLLLMSLIKIDKYNKFWMHDEIRDLGRYLVKEENLEDAGKRRWVWIDENTLDLLTSNEEKLAVRALSLGISHDFTPEELARFPNLRFLGGKRMNFVGNFKNLLPNLKWLSWQRCPLNFRAMNLHPVNLVVLDLSWSKITHKWGGWRQIKMAKKLKVLNLENCYMLTETPDFSKFGKLEKLILAWCTELSTIDSSIGKLKLLSALNFKGCSSLQELPKEIGSLECLSEIFLCSTSKRFKFPETLGNLKSLTKFEIYRCPRIGQLPRSIGKLTNLTHLILHGCKTLHELPDSLGELESLAELDIRRSYISTLPDSIGHLKRLKVITVAHSRLQAIPCALGQVETLEVLDASYCRHIMDEIPWKIWSLARLRTLDLSMTPIFTLPPKIRGFSSLQILKLGRLGRGLSCPLPELPSSLKFLEVVRVDNFNVLPDLSSLVHLDHLNLSGPLTALWSENENEVMLSIHRLPRGLSTLILHYIPQLPDFSDLKNLSVLTIFGCPMPHFPVLKSLERLRKLEVISCKFLERTPDLSGLKKLEELRLDNLDKLAEIPGLGELESLEFLHIWHCGEIEQLPNLSKLKNLRYFDLWESSKIRAVEGLEELISLKKAEIFKCESLERLPDLSAFTKLETDWKPPKFAEDTIQSNTPGPKIWGDKKASPRPARSQNLGCFGVGPWSSLLKAFKRGH